MGFITKKMHAYLDYPIALALIGLPFILQLGSSNSLAFYISAFTGIAALSITLFTNHQTGTFKVISYKMHLMVDFAVGLAFLVVPFKFGFRGIDMIYYLVNGATVLFIVGMHKAENSISLLQALNKKTKS